MTRIAFLGLGHMGLPMAINLHNAGHQITGFDVVPAAIEAARAAGLVVAETANDTVLNAEIVITMFPSGKHVIDAYAGGLLDSAPPNTLFIDCSTISVGEAQEAHSLAAAAGHRALDAPVSGGVVGATNGTLAFMIGGTPHDLVAAGDVFDIMGARTVHCGGDGLGQAAKVCNNMILAVSQIAVAEAFVLGERLGLSHQALFDVSSAASGQCWALNTNCPVPGPVPTSPANRDYEPGFAGALMAKDLGLALRAIEATGVDAQLGRHAQQMYEAYAAGVGAHKDFSGIINTIRAESGE